MSGREETGEEETMNDVLNGRTYRKKKDANDHQRKEMFVSFSLFLSCLAIRRVTCTLTKQLID
jgi:hypothetical protein